MQAEEESESNQTELGMKYKLQDSLVQFHHGVVTLVQYYLKPGPCRDTAAGPLLLSISESNSIREKTLHIFLGEVSFVRLVETITLRDDVHAGLAGSHHLLYMA